MLLTVKELISMLSELNESDLVLIKTKQGIKEIVAVSSSDDADYKETYLETYEE